MSKQTIKDNHVCNILIALKVSAAAHQCFLEQKDLDNNHFVFLEYEGFLKGSLGLLD